MHRDPKFPVHLLILGVAAVAGGIGCASREDRAFELDVVPVLARAAELDSTTTIPVPASDGSNWNAVVTEGERALSDLEVFRLGVSKLPHPGRRELRYMRLKLVLLGEAAEGFVHASIGSRASMMPSGIPQGSMIDLATNVRSAALTEGMWRAGFFEALREAAVAERIVLRSSVLLSRHVPPPTEGESYAPRPDVWSDSLMRRVELLERAEMSAERR